MNITFNRKGMRLQITKNEIDNMIYIGFESMTQYIDERCAKTAEDTKERIDVIGF
jgi:hypothetical protein